MKTPNYGFAVCFLPHCLLCGQHHRGVNHYCEHCTEDRFEEVERDARIRSYSRKWRIMTGCTHDEAKEME